MITEYRVTSTGSVESSAVETLHGTANRLWLDVMDPTPEELARLSEAVGFEVPDRQDMAEIELSSRLYFEDDAYVMIALLLPLSGSDIMPPSSAAFILKKDLLLTIRHSEFHSFSKTAALLAKNKAAPAPFSVFCDLFDESVSDCAGGLEYSMRRMEALTSSMFRTAFTEKKKAGPDSPELDEALLLIGAMGERVSNIRESVGSLQRAVNFVRTYVPADWTGGGKNIMRSLRADLTALSDEADFFMNKLTFNLDATLGMINIEETKIIRVLSIVTLVLSPPVLVAGIYGMNFRGMPELEWRYGYIFSLILMAGAAILPILYLKWKKWF